MVSLPGASALAASRTGAARKRNARRTVAVFVIGPSLAREGLGILPHRSIDQLLVGSGGLAGLDAAELLLGRDHGIEVLLAESVVVDRPQLDARESRQRFLCALLGTS